MSDQDHQMLPLISDFVDLQISFEASVRFCRSYDIHASKNVHMQIYRQSSWRMFILHGSAYKYIYTFSYIQPSCTKHRNAQFHWKWVKWNLTWTFQIQCITNTGFIRYSKNTPYEILIWIDKHNCIYVLRVQPPCGLNLIFTNGENSLISKCLVTLLAGSVSLSHEKENVDSWVFIEACHM